VGKYGIKKCEEIMTESFLNFVEKHKFIDSKYSAKSKQKRGGKCLTDYNEVARKQIQNL